MQAPRDHAKPGKGRSNLSLKQEDRLRRVSCRAYGALRVFDVHPRLTYAMGYHMPRRWRLVGEGGGTWLLVGCSPKASKVIGRLRPGG